MSRFKSISQDTFAELFRPLPNHLNCFAAFDFGNGYGTLFETFGQELDHVSRQSASHIWTLCSGDDGDFICSGLHFVNRLGYFVTEYGVPDGVEIEVGMDGVVSGDTNNYETHPDGGYHAAFC
ncbi:MAG: hypothetical protein R3E01_36170 [Pirellulaceae bacterium]|nr:hypothetical protein [Planctomycetales bacterium]